MGLRDRIRRVNERLMPGHLTQPPQTVVLGVNNFCNLYCRMCDVGTGNAETNFGANLVGAKTRIMSLDLYGRVLREMRTWCPRSLLAFVYTEPLAWPHMAEALTQAAEAGIRTQVTTNGLLLPRHAEAIARAGCEAVVVSLDGHEAVHDFIRRKQGSYARATEGIATLRAQPNAPPVTVVCTITEWNVGHLAQMARGLAGLDIARLLIIHNQFVSEDIATAHNRAHPALEATASNVFESNIAAIDLEALSRDLDEVAGLSLPFPVQIQPDRIALDALREYYDAPEAYVGTGCTDPFRIAMVDADGEVIPAHGRCFRFPVGNIEDQPLSTLWNAAPMAALRRELVQAGGLLPACSRCCGGVT